jgi:hypothetical protein
MPQVYLIVSHRGAELGFAAVIHPSDFTDQQFKTKVRRLAPLIFDALPPPGSDDVRDLTRRLEESGRWHYRLKTRLEPNGDDFPDLEGLLTFLKSPDGRARGAGTIARYWLPEELDGSVDLGAEFAAAVWQFYPLLHAGRLAPGAVMNSTSDLDDPASAPEPTTDAKGAIRGALERFPRPLPRDPGGQGLRGRPGAVGGP